MALAQFLSHPPPPPPDTPPKEISKLACACVVGDLDIKDVKEIFRINLEAFQRKGYPWYQLWPVLLTAVEYIRPIIVQFLLEHGVQLFTIHIRKAIETGSTEIFHAFISSGWDLNQQLGDFNPPALAYVIESYELTQWFLDQGADPNASCYLDITPTSRAIRRASLQTIELLFDRGASVQKGQLIHHVVDRDQDVIEITEFLLAKGARLNEIQYHDHPQSRNHEFFKGLGTPLHRATELLKVDIVKYLLEKGADRSIRNSNRQTALDIAKKLRHQELVDLLEHATV